MSTLFSISEGISKKIDGGSWGHERDRLVFNGARYGQGKSAVLSEVSFVTQTHDDDPAHTAHDQRPEGLSMAFDTSKSINLLLKFAIPKGPRV